MKKIIASVIVLVGLALLGWKIFVKLTAEEQAAARRGRRAVAVEVQAIEHRTMRDVSEFTGTLLPFSQFAIAPKVSGRLEKLMVNIGDTVANGDLIAVLDSAEYAQDVAQATAELAVSRANLADARSARAVAEREYVRAKELFDEKVASEAELDQAQARYDATKAKYDVADAQIKQKEAALKAAQVRLSYTTIRARWGDERGAEAPPEKPPPSEDGGSTEGRRNGRSADPPLPRGATEQPPPEGGGSAQTMPASAPAGCRVVAERFVDEGTMLRANDPIVSIVDLNSVLAVINVIERDFADVRVGQEAVLTTDARPKEVFVGRVVRKAPVLKEESRQARVEIEIPNPEGKLAAGMFVRARVEFAVHEDATAVPAGALVRRDDKQGVFLVNEGDDKARFVPVTVGIVQREAATPGDVDGDPASAGAVRPKEWAEIVEPPISGSVVTLGQHLLEDGAAVNAHRSQPVGVTPSKDTGGLAP